MDVWVVSTLAVVNNAVMNMGIQITVRVSVSVPFGYIPRSGITESYGNSMFNFLKDHQTVFYRGFCINFDF